MLRVRLHTDPCARERPRSGHARPGWARPGVHCGGPARPIPLLLEGDVTHALLGEAFSTHRCFTDAMAEAEAEEVAAAKEVADAAEAAEAAAASPLACCGGRHAA